MNNYTLEEVRTIARGSWRASNGDTVSVPGPDGDTVLPAGPGGLNTGALVLDFIATFETVNAGLIHLSRMVDDYRVSAEVVGLPTDVAEADVVVAIADYLTQDWAYYLTR